MRKVVSVAFAVVAAAGLKVMPALADGPGVGTPTVVSVGDSAISARPAAGRATPTARQQVDALGSTRTTTTRPGRRGDPRLPSLEVGRVHIGGGVTRLNLACSGAQTYDAAVQQRHDFKPGLDFYDDGAGHMGQALVLQQYAATHNVKMVVALIGANDYGFADIVQHVRARLAHVAVVVEELLPRRLEHDPRSSPPPTSPHHHARQERATSTCAPRCATAATPTPRGRCSRRPTHRRSARLADPLLRVRLHAPERRRLRRLERGHQLGQRHRRANAQRHGAQRASPQREMPNIALFEAQNALVGHRLCENADGLWRSRGSRAGARRARPTARMGLADPHDDDAVRALPAPGGRAPVLLGPAGAAQLPAPGLNGGAPRGGTCSRTATGLNGQGEPNMRFG